jgi:hypothetical protein
MNSHIKNNKKLLLYIGIIVPTVQHSTVSKI